jgi:predicted nucleotidyltransferase
MNEIMLNMIQTENNRKMKKISENNLLADKEKNLLMKCKHIIQNIDASADVILYGSRARGDADQESDYDLLILTDNIANIEKEDLIRRQLFPVEIETGAVITIFLIKRQEWDTPLFNAVPFYQNIKREGVIL